MPDVKIPPNGLILIDKPKGITSFDVIRKLRKLTGVKKIGHAGTLDPLASGLLVLCSGSDTKKLKDYIGLPKVYEADVLIGIKTDSGDLEGNILEQKAVQNLDEKLVSDTLENMAGKIKLPVPLYSAIKVSGKPLYARARKGEKPEVPIKEMEILWMKKILLKRSGDKYLLKLELEVKSGTYIRSVAEEIGSRLGCPSTVSELRRTKIGNFRVEDAEKLVID